ncbi:glycosyltransferase [Methanolobus profundi]|uniref:Glycosyltransferase involved in cell wall bisynthesis n=1 Tax=Methanolobus profundi TaxID=487685 RepID=A0A1I4RVP1_9EURY|nr:glycosyltransferase [Methanolobus profundi]SFM56302.1 Glycosyltransferase involved in cell wall bisynthesis [Methanolobus profundi]
MSSNNLLVITNNYPNEDDSYVGGIFVKEQINYLKHYFKNIYVISPVAYGIDKFRKTTYKNYKYDNVEVFYPKYFNIPLFYFCFKDSWIYFATKAIIKSIESKNLNFAIIHSHFTWPSGSCSIKIGDKYDVPVIVTEHTSITFQRAVERKEKIFIDTWDKCDAIIRVRKNDISSFESIGISKNKVFPIPNGFDSSIFYNDNTLECRKKLGLPLDKKILLYVGNLYDEAKGHKYLIEAMNDVVKYRDDVFCVIVGNGKLKNVIQDQIMDFKLENYVKLVGGKSHDEIPLWMNSCDIFVLPSLNEGNPTVMFECLGCGKPFVGTKVGGVPEVIISDEYGLLVNPGNSRELANKILSALGKDWDSNVITNYAYNFRWENISKQIITVYEKAGYVH